MAFYIKLLFPIPQQKGVAQRKDRHLLEVARAQAKLPLFFGGECIRTAPYCIESIKCRHPGKVSSRSFCSY